MLTAGKQDQDMIAIRHSLIALLLLSCAATTAEAASSRIYRTVDEQGNVVFTDIPPRDDQESEQVVTETPNSFDAAEAVPEADAWIVDPDAAAEPVFSYAALSVASPANDEAVRENTGNVTIVADIEPRLRPGHMMRLLLDGAIVQEGRQATFALTNLDRGTHVVALEIVDADGRVIKNSEDSTFHMLRYHLPPKPPPKPIPHG